MPYFSKTNSKQTNDFTGKIIIEVMANFSKDGRFRPEYFKYVSVDESIYWYKIEGIKYSKEYPEKFLFCCKFKNSNMLNEVVLEYYIMEHIWLLKQ